MEKAKNEIQTPKKEETSIKKESTELGKIDKEKKDKFEKNKEIKEKDVKKCKSESEKEVEDIEQGMKSESDKEKESKKKGNKKENKEKKRENENKERKEQKEDKGNKKGKEDKNIIIPEVLSKQTDDKKYSRKLNKLGGEAFEKMISYKIVHKFFLEDILRATNAKEIERNFNMEQYLDVKMIKKEILDKLSPSNNFDLENNNLKIDYTTQFNKNISQYFNCQDIYNNIYIKSENISSSGISSENSKEYKSDSINPEKTNLKSNKGNFSKNSNPKNNNFNSNTDNTTNSNQENENTNSKLSKKKKNINMKDITELEFDLFLKDVSGKKLLNFINEMDEKKRLIKYKEIERNGEVISEDKYYNICIEITVQSDDILTKKIPQLYKSIACFNFLYKTYNYFQEIKESDMAY